MIRTPDNTTADHSCHASQPKCIGTLGWLVRYYHATGLLDATT